MASATWRARAALAARSGSCPSIPGKASCWNDAVINSAAASNAAGLTDVTRSRSAASGGVPHRPLLTCSSADQCRDAPKRESAKAPGDSSNRLLGIQRDWNVSRYHETSNWLDVHQKLPGG